MITIGNTAISDDIADQFFVCDLAKCKGACCEEGDLGAPLEENELPLIDELLDKVKPYMSPQGRKAMEAQGPYLKDYEGDYSTTTVKGKECVFAIAENGSWKCAIEKAWKEGKTDFRKPISCHLYPIRITKYDYYDALNYHRWHICNPACHQGKSLRVELYRFLKEPLIRKYGEAWYDELVRLIEHPSD